MTTDLDAPVADDAPAVASFDADRPHPLKPEKTALGLTGGDRLFLTGLAVVLLALMSVHLLRMSLRGTEAIHLVRPEAHRFEFQVDINRSNWVQWMQLPEVGEVLARKIVKFREESGDFRSVEDVRRVPGIGPAIMDQIRPYLKWNEATAAGDKENPAPAASADPGM